MNKISEYIWELTEVRTQEMPPIMQMAIMGKLLAKDDILKEVKSRTEIGEIIVNMQIEYLRYCLRDK